MEAKSLVKAIAKERILLLLDMAEQNAHENTEQSRALEKRYVRLAKRISAHYRIKIPKELKHRICKRCDNFMVPGINCKVRVSGSFLVYKCECGNEKRIFLKKENKK
ncbi:MAG: ribonuclease P protein component 4 [Candidatus Micrarchaeia archaeon]